MQFAEYLSQGVQPMKKNSGFTLIELMIVIAVMAIVASIGVPSFVGWRSEAKLRSAVSLLRADFEMAKSRARIENNFVAMVFNTNGYTIFIDDGAGGGVAGDYVRQANERLLITRQLSAGVTIDLANSDFEGVDQTRFNGQGRIGRRGQVTLVNSSGVQRILDADNRFGRITVN
jgi:prepilin-type N-terminal cleavage/methylation domain-containing protein